MAYDKFLPAMKVSINPRTRKILEILTEKFKAADLYTTQSDQLLAAGEARNKSGWLNSMWQKAEFLFQADYDAKFVEFPRIHVVLDPYAKAIWEAYSLELNAVFEKSGLPLAGTSKEEQGNPNFVVYILMQRFVAFALSNTSRQDGLAILDMLDSFLTEVKPLLLEKRFILADRLTEFGVFLSDRHAHHLNIIRNTVETIQQITANGDAISAAQTHLETLAHIIRSRLLALMNPNLPETAYLTSGNQHLSYFRRLVQEVAQQALEESHAHPSVKGSLRLLLQDSQYRTKEQVEDDRQIRERGLIVRKPRGDLIKLETNVAQQVDTLEKLFSHEIFAEKFVSLFCQRNPKLDSRVARDLIDGLVHTLRLRTVMDKVDRMNSVASWIVFMMKIFNISQITAALDQNYHAVRDVIDRASVEHLPMSSSSRKALDKHGLTTTIKAEREKRAAIKTFGAVDDPRVLKTVMGLLQDSILTIASESARLRLGFVNQAQIKRLMGVMGVKRAIEPASAPGGGIKIEEIDEDGNVIRGDEEVVDVSPADQRIIPEAMAERLLHYYYGGRVETFDGFDKAEQTALLTHELRKQWRDKLYDLVFEVAQHFHSSSSLSDAQLLDIFRPILLQQDGYLAVDSKRHQVQRRDGLAESISAFIDDVLNPIYQQAHKVNGTVAAELKRRFREVGLVVKQPGMQPYLEVDTTQIPGENRRRLQALLESEQIIDRRRLPEAPYFVGRNVKPKPNQEVLFGGHRMVDNRPTKEFVYYLTQHTWGLTELQPPANELKAATVFMQKTVNVTLKRWFHDFLNQAEDELLKIVVNAVERSQKGFDSAPKAGLLLGALVMDPKAFQQRDKRERHEAIKQVFLQRLAFYKGKEHGLDALITLIQKFIEAHQETITVGFQDETIVRLLKAFSEATTLRLGARNSRRAFSFDDYGQFTADNLGVTRQTFRRFYEDYSEFQTDCIEVAQEALWKENGADHRESGALVPRRSVVLRMQAERRGVVARQERRSNRRHSDEPVEVQVVDIKKLVSNAKTEYRRQRDRIKAGSANSRKSLKSLESICAGGTVTTLGRVLAYLQAGKGNWRSQGRDQSLKFILAERLCHETGTIMLEEGNVTRANITSAITSLLLDTMGLTADKRSTYSEVTRYVAKIVHKAMSIAGEHRFFAAYGVQNDTSLWKAATLVDALPTLTLNFKDGSVKTLTEAIKEGRPSDDVVTAISTQQFEVGRQKENGREAEIESPYFAALFTSRSFIGPKMPASSKLTIN